MTANTEGATEISSLLRSAWDAVEAACLPEHVQITAFQEAMHMAIRNASSGAIIAGKEKGPEFDGTSLSGDDANQGASEQAIYERVAQHTGVSSNRIEQLIHLDDGEIRISIPSLRLGKNNAERTRNAARILAVTRGFGLDEDGTPVETIRREVNRLKCYDQPNFAGSISKLDGYVTKGSGNNRRIQVKSQGVESFANLVDAILGSEG